jgi:hypothetical protein
MGSCSSSVHARIEYEGSFPRRPLPGEKTIELNPLAASSGPYFKSNSKQKQDGRPFPAAQDRSVSFEPISFLAFSGRPAILPLDECRGDFIEGSIIPATDRPHPERLAAPAGP